MSYANYSYAPTGVELLPAEIVASYLGSAPIQVEQIVGALGLQLAFAPLGEISGKIERIADRYKITVNSADGHARKRFTMAHEIAHYILHRDLIGDGIEDDAMYRSRLGGYLETQANHYAAYVLMPPPLFRATYRSGVKSYPDLARHFAVSQQAAEIRAKSLGLV
ncbi:MAG TPA: ImmA/IrrE family metallo-endopeptidase [Rhizomicrobium sp.]|nr:ImmA/IrrE family metallo-endopeptidase [Rhizomicrobium sp.]